MNHVNIIVDICCNHCGDFEIAKEMILTAKECGADFVKLQKRDIDSIPEQIRNRDYRSSHSFGRTYGEHRMALEFSTDDFTKLINYAESCDIGCFATPFDIRSFEQLSVLDLPYIKFGSTQVHDEEMIRAAEIIRTTPIILSTGMCSLKRIIEVNKKIFPSVIMQTTSSYPCDENNVHLKVIGLLKKQFPGAFIGLSGHYVSGNGAIEAAAVAVGATWIERHFTLDRTWKGSDQACSLEPEGLKNVVKAVRTIERAMGKSEKKKLECEEEVWRKING